MTSTETQQEERVVRQIQVGRHTIRPFDILDSTITQSFIDSVKTHIDTWDDNSRLAPSQSISDLLSGNHILYTIDEGRGFIWFSGVQPGFQASVHGSIRSLRLAGRDDVFHATCSLASYHLGLQRIYAIIPDWKAGAIKTTARLMTYEGTMRSSLLYHATWRDGHLFSLIRPELPPIGDEEA